MTPPTTKGQQCAMSARVVLIRVCRCVHRRAAVETERTARNAMEYEGEIQDPSPTFKSPVWQHFGFPVEEKDELQRDGFCQNPFFECLVAEIPEEHKSKEGFTVVGYALYFYTYSTWKGSTVYLEDLYVMSEFRGNGIGTGLLSKVAEVAKKKKQCVQLQLSVFDWNTPRDFYAAKGAQDLTDTEGWHFIRFDGQNLDNLANEAPKD